METLKKSTMKGFVLVMSVVLAVTVIVFANQSQISTVSRKTHQGTIMGKRLQMAAGTYQSYTGIPYAQPPVGRLRFQPPEPIDVAWDGTIDAKQYPPICPQIKNNQVVGQEDCLYLNIYLPDIKKDDVNAKDDEDIKNDDVNVKDDEKIKNYEDIKNDEADINKERDDGLAVMVFIHGGAFVTGGSNPEEYGPKLLNGHGVILVTINYRLGPLGFLSTETPSAPGNLGLRDMIAALDWVSNNIVHFGGNSRKVTVFGESAGSMAISALLVTTAPFQRAILQSGTLARPFFLQSLGDSRTEYARQLGNDLDCNQMTEEDLLKCLQNKSVADIVTSSAKFIVHTAWQPVVDRYLGDEAILPVDPLTAIEAGNAKDVDIMIGSNEGDGMPQLGKTVYTKPNFYKSLQNNFSSAGPLLMLGRKNPSRNDIILSEKIRNFYLNDTQFSPEIDAEMMTLMTDNMYQAGGRKILDVLADQGIKSLYQYIFSYVGSVTNTELWFNMSRPELGACHADELYYLFSRDEKSPLLTSQDVLVSDTLVKFWTNFAKTGNPNSPERPQLENTAKAKNGFDVWTPFTRNKKEYLNIRSSLVMELPENYKLRVKFWENIFRDIQLGIKESSIARMRSHGINDEEL